jgi:hypothetical protein
MNEGERRSKKIYKHGDIVTFRLVKKIKYSDDVIDLINKASQSNELNKEIIKALELYAKYQRYSNSFTIPGVSEIEASFFKNINDNQISKDLSASANDPGDEVFGDVAIDSSIIEEYEEVFNNQYDSNMKSKEDKVIVIENWPNSSDLSNEKDSAEDELFSSNSNIGSKTNNSSGSKHRSGMNKALKSIRRG